MLETYFVKPQTIDRIRALWIGRDRALRCWLAGRVIGARSVLAPGPAAGCLR